MNNSSLEQFLILIDLAYGMEELAQEAEKGIEEAQKVYGDTLDTFKNIVLNAAIQNNKQEFIKELIKLDNKLRLAIDEHKFVTIELESYLKLIREYVGLEMLQVLFDFDINKYTLENEEFEKIMSLYMYSGFNDELMGLGMYVTAMTQSKSQPDKAYVFALKAFEVRPNLAQGLKCDYMYDKEKLEEDYFEKCPICHSEEAVPHYCVPQLYVVQGNSMFSPVKLWLKCKECGNIYAYNFPVMKMGEINGHYTKGAEDNTIEPRNSLRIYSDIFNKCKEISKGNRYLEIGIGTGEMLAAAMEMGYDVEAVEICKEDCEKVSSVLGVDINWCDFKNFNTEKKYDVIIMGDVLEHISDPVGALKKAKSLLSDEGVLWISTPNYNSGFSRLMKFKDAMWNQKNHFTYFSYETLLPILHNLELEVVKYDISNRYRGSMEIYCVNKYNENER